MTNNIEEKKMRKINFWQQLGEKAPIHAFDYLFPFVAIGGESGNFYILNLEDESEKMKRFHTRPINIEAIRAIKFISKGEFIFLACNYHKIYILETYSGKLIHILDNQHYQM